MSSDTPVPGHATASGVAFVKAHGTENDFVVFYDPDAGLELTPQRVRQLCDRRAGIGADGVIRIARACHFPGIVPQDAWFMDYHNADGSVAEMCGNGVRVFAHVLAHYGHLPLGQEVAIATRAGRRTVVVHAADETAAQVSVGMGEIKLLGVATAWQQEERYAGLGIDVGNPHVAAVIPGLTAQQLQELPVGEPVQVDPGMFPQGANVEVVTPLADGEVSMRVHERGCGETRSCGTGTVAAAFAALSDANLPAGTVRVNIPGGQVQVTVEVANSSAADAAGAMGDAAGDAPRYTATLSGPSRIVATGHWLGF